MHKAVFTEEFYQLYDKYNIAVHDKERDRAQCKKYYCCTNLYNPGDPIEKIAAPCNGLNLDDDKKFIPDGEGIYGGLGSYHMYHRIDGKLVAVGVLDITDNILDTAQFVYDTDYKFLYLGVIGAIHELEYMKMI